MKYSWLHVYIKEYRILSAVVWLYVMKSHLSCVLTFTHSIFTLHYMLTQLQASSWQCHVHMGVLAFFACLNSIECHFPQLHESATCSKRWGLPCTAKFCNRRSRVENPCALGLLLSYPSQSKTKVLSLQGAACAGFSTQCSLICCKQAYWA